MHGHEKVMGERHDEKQISRTHGGRFFPTGGPAWVRRCLGASLGGPGASLGIIEPSTFSHPQAVPAGTRVPQWTLLDITFLLPQRANIWNATAARIVGDTPEVLPGVLINTSSGSGPNTGAIAGGVAGGVIAMAVIAGLVLAFWRRRRRAQEPSSTSVVDDAPSPPSASQMGQFRPAPSDDTPVPPQTMLNRQEGVLTSTPNLNVPVVSHNGYLNGNNPTNMRPLHLPVQGQGYHGLPMV
ncbi:hypothetical protein EDB84DRAFT_1440037 [Lactarius hengduanensis]|nr:hypothetical protein EDB84DRAFT_1440037 [Lactarius hengduanensis]